jgi:hypothetical protein
MVCMPSALIMLKMPPIESMMIGASAASLHEGSVGRPGAAR